jgi:hypothetical protein
LKVNALVQLLTLLVALEWLLPLVATWMSGLPNVLAPIGLGTAQPSFLRFEKSILGMGESELDIGIGRDISVAFGEPVLVCLTKTP